MKSLKRTLGGVLGLFLLTLLLVACGESTPVSLQGEGTTTLAPAVTSAPATNPALPLGIYSATLKAKDFHPEFTAAAPAIRQYFGNWQLKLKEMSAFELVLNQKVVTSGSYQLNQDQIVFNSNNWPSYYPDTRPVAETVTYGWNFNGQTLQLLGQDGTGSVRGLIFCQELRFSDTGIYR
ncbi:MAG TPA: hypothetical protein VH186_26910 [Chloroflexia bacterium]|nr:hypothetical protein [Chloroflexia bacterium]